MREGARHAEREARLRSLGGSRIMHSRLRVVIALGLLSALMRVGPSPVLAGTTGAINGVVSDAAGHPIDAAEVSASAPSFTTKTVTGGNGFYALIGLPLDTYAVSFAKPGFQTRIIPGVTISQDQTRRVDAVLQV